MFCLCPLLSPFIFSHNIHNINSQILPEFVIIGIETAAWLYFIAAHVRAAGLLFVCTDRLEATCNHTDPYS